ncbi:MAG: riboflavin synthase [Candidatus Margulisiibacteriota bacterium]
MFTGIIEQVGTVVSLIRTGSAAKLAIAAPKLFDDVKIGDSVAANGVCLTVTAVRRDFAEFDLSAETLKRSTFTFIRIGDKLNLEKALPISGRLGGHLVSGHIDGTGEIRHKVGSGEGLELHLSVPSELIQYLVPKGSIAVDGVSLTVADFRDGLVQLAVVPHTLKTTTLGQKAISDRVNIEVDMLSKYIEKHLHGEPRGISEEMMMRAGFMPLGWSDN